MICNLFKVLIAHIKKIISNNYRIWFNGTTNLFFTTLITNMDYANLVCIFKGFLKIFPSQYEQIIAKTKYLLQYHQMQVSKIL